ncbi:MAG: hypothetical protein H5U03_07325 [Clostridia bacterium]|nr:hypothetical protein [Clostridia bacterium]
MGSWIEGCKVEEGGARYSPAFKFRVVLEALKAEGKGGEGHVTRGHRVY